MKESTNALLPTLKTLLKALLTSGSEVKTLLPNYSLKIVITFAMNGLFLMIWQRRNSGKSKLATLPPKKELYKSNTGSQ